MNHLAARKLIPPRELSRKRRPYIRWILPRMIAQQRRCARGAPHFFPGIYRSQIPMGPPQVCECIWSCPGPCFLDRRRGDVYNPGERLASASFILARVRILNNMETKEARKHAETCFSQPCLGRLYPKHDPYHVSMYTYAIIHNLSSPGRRTVY